MSPEADQTFTDEGFVVLRRVVDPAMWLDLRERCTAELARYGATPELSDQAGGVQSMHLPLLGWGDGTLDAFAESSWLEATAESLCRRDVLLDPVTVEAVVYRSAVPWHRDASVDTLGVKLVAYLDGLTGADRLLVAAGSHLSGCATEVEVRSRHRVDALELGPGDMLAFDLRLWHANPGPGPRRQWTVSYLSLPANDREAEAARSWLREGERYDARGTGIERSWINRRWFSGVERDQRVERWVVAMRALGRMVS